MSCNCNCNICRNLVTVSSLTIVGNNLVMNVPQRNFANGQCACFIVTQAVPAAATINMPVVITIGSAATQYPLVTCVGTPVTASMLDSRGRFRLKTQVATTAVTATPAVFRVIKGLCNTNLNVFPSIPTTTTAPATGGTT